jgi:hypothetical protein
MEKEFLKPLECAERYLKQFGREGLYRTISTSISDREGRWQALKDYSNTLSGVFQNQAKLLEYGIEESEIGTIEEAAFDIIRLRVIPDMPKVHSIMRNLAKLCHTKEGKRAILAIVDKVEARLPASECRDESDNPLKLDAVDAKWAAKNQQAIIHNVKKASECHEIQKGRETPLELMEAAYRKLTHDDMDIGSLSAKDLGEALKIVEKIRARAYELASKIYRTQKDLKNWQGGRQ